MNGKKVSRKKASVVNLLFNYANASFAIITSLVFVPLYLNYFSIGTYGSYLASGNIVSMLGLLEAGTSMVVTQKLSTSYAKKDWETFSNFVGAGLFLSFCLTIILLTLSFCLVPFISIWVKSEPEEYRNLQYAFVFSAGGAGLGLAFSNISAVFQAWLKGHISGLVNLIAIIVGISTTLIGLKVGLGVISIPLGILLRGLVGVVTLSFCLLSILNKEQYPKVRIQKRECMEVIKSAIPMFGTNVAKSIVTNSQLLIITNYIDPVASAIFFITSRIYTVCDYFLTPIGSSIYSSVSHLVGENNDEKIKTSIIRVFVLFSAFSAFLMASSFALNGAFISLWLGADKFGGNALSGLLCIAMMFSARFKFLEFNLYALGIFGKTIFYDIIGSIIRTIIIFILIRYIGGIALPLAEILSAVLILGWYINKLLIKRLRMQQPDAVRFVPAGLLTFSVALLLAYLWNLYVPVASGFKSFIGQSLIVGFIAGSIVFLLTEEVRVIVIELLTNLRKRN